MLLDIAATLFWIFVTLFLIAGILTIVFSFVLVIVFVWFLWKERNGSESDS